MWKVRVHTCMKAWKAASQPSSRRSWSSMNMQAASHRTALDSSSSKMYFSSPSMSSLIMSKCFDAVMSCTQVFSHHLQSDLFVVFLLLSASVWIAQNRLGCTYKTTTILSRRVSEFQSAGNGSGTLGSTARGVLGNPFGAAVPLNNGTQTLGCCAVESSSHAQAGGASTAAATFPARRVTHGDYCRHVRHEAHDAVQHDASIEVLHR